jgi:hypothetical protein
MCKTDPAASPSHPTSAKCGRGEPCTGSSSCRNGNCKLSIPSPTSAFLGKTSPFSLLLSTTPSPSVVGTPSPPPASASTHGLLLHPRLPASATPRPPPPDPGRCGLPPSPHAADGDGDDGGLEHARREAEPVRAVDGPRRADAEHERVTSSTSTGGDGGTVRARGDEREDLLQCERRAEELNQRLRVVERFRQGHLRARASAAGSAPAPPARAAPAPDPGSAGSGDSIFRQDATSAVAEVACPSSLLRPSPRAASFSSSHRSSASARSQRPRELIYLLLTQQERGDR